MFVWLPAEYWNIHDIILIVLEMYFIKIVRSASSDPRTNPLRRYSTIRIRKWNSVFIINRVWMIYTEIWKSEISLLTGNKHLIFMMKIYLQLSFGIKFDLWCKCYITLNLGWFRKIYSLLRLRFIQISKYRKCYISIY